MLACIGLSIRKLVMSMLVIVKAWRYGDIVGRVGFFMKFLLEYMDSWIIVRKPPFAGVCVEHTFLCLV